MTTTRTDAPVLDCFYSLSSPWAYLGNPQLQDIVRRHRAHLVFKPFDFQMVVPHTGGIPLKTRPEARRSYHSLELARWSDRLGLPLNLAPAHYPKTAPADPNWNKYPGWMVIAAQHQYAKGQGPHPFDLSHALLRALWAEERNTADAATRVQIANDAGYDGAALFALEAAPETQATYQANSQEAIELGIFGAPTFMFEGFRFWGQDRLDFVDRAMAKAAVR